MSVHFDPTGGISVDLQAMIEAIRKENHQAIDRRVMSYVAYRELSRLRNQLDGKLRYASKKCPQAFEQWIQGYVQFDTSLLHKIICSPHMYKWGLTNSTRKAITAFVGNVERVQSNYHNGDINMANWNRLAQCRKQTGKLLTEAIRKSKKASEKVFWFL
jgi:macrodomain Ter protein organizer (MatP/YcbG family)